MGNKLFQQAQEAVSKAIHCTDNHEQTMLVEKAKNALSSAYANSTTAEKSQLRELQQELQGIQ